MNAAGDVPWDEGQGDSDQGDVSARRAVWRGLERVRGCCAALRLLATYCAAPLPHLVQVFKGARGLGGGGMRGGWHERGVA